MEISMIQAMSKQDDQRKTERELKKLQKDYDALKRQYDQLRKDKEELESQNSELTSKVASLITVIEKLEEEKNVLKGKIKKLEFDLDMIKRDAEEAKLEAQSIRNDYSKLAAKFTETELTNEKKNRYIKDLGSKVETLMAEKEAYEEMINEQQSTADDFRKLLAISGGTSKKLENQLIDYGTTGVQILFRRLATCTQNKIIRKVMGREGIYGIYTLGQLEKYLTRERETATKEIEIWKKIKKNTPQLNDGSLFNTIKELKEGGNMEAHEIQPNDVEKARLAVEKYPTAYHSNLKLFLDFADSILKDC